MKVTTYKCDECGKIKKDTNRWWVVSLGASLEIQKWPSDPISDDLLTLCGEECVHKKVSEFLAQAAKS